MAKRHFTDEQRSAIETRDKTLLVSAAAGSGKTATLTERIIQSVLDENSPESISRMLIVTFTNAAVKELRDRISAALKEKLAENRENTRLEKEIYLLPSARICTIDSFCNEILKNNAERFGITPGYRIADKIESDILSRSILGALIEAVYNGEFDRSIASPEEFEELTGALVGVKTDASLEDELLRLYERTRSLPEGVLVYKRFSDYCMEKKELPPEENRYAQYGINKAKSVAKHYTGLYLTLESELDSAIPAEAKYLDILAADRELFQRILSAKTYREEKDILDSRTFQNLPPVRGEKSEAVIRCAAARSDMKEALGKKCADRYFTCSEEEWSEHLLLLGRALGIIYRLLDKFDELFFEEKRRRGILEHSDIEKLAYESLYTESGEPSELALSMKEQFSSVYVDEYQDVNALQGRIFEAVANDRNRFMVGDIKQSIYGFRSAEPAIFAKMKNDFPALAVSADSTCASIFMSKNFRCDRGVVDFVNGIFDEAFMLAKESIGYVREDRLEFAKLCDGGEPTYREPLIRLFDKSHSLAIEETDDEDDESESSPSAAIEAESPKDLPPIWVAEEIRRLIESEELNNGNPIEPRDIAIILRKDGGRSREYADALKVLGIDATVPDDKDFFLNAEVELVLCLLNTVDNPERDIYLAGLMCSPLYGFTPDELYFMRKLFGDGSLWESLLVYSESEDFEKGKRFIRDIRRYRAIAEGMPVDALILRLYKETGILTLAAKNGCKENLMLLYNYARKFEASSFEGLYSFISYINTVIESDAEFSAKKETGEENAVTITTIHKSKGLEYPIVFIADAGASLISASERKARVPYSEGFGAALRARVPNGLALIDNPIFNAIKDHTSDKTKEEELRVYYVALTRARERLYITGVADTKLIEEYIEKSEIEKSFRSEYTLQRMKSFIDILMMARKGGILQIGQEIGDMTDPMAEKSKNSDKSIEKDEAHPSVKSQISESESESASNELYAKLMRRFTFKYPNEDLTLLPEKMSVSRLYPSVLDEADEYTATLFSTSVYDGEHEYELDSSKPCGIGEISNNNASAEIFDRANGKTRQGEENENSDQKKKSRPILPRFATGTDENESALRGIATHLVLQFADLENLARSGTDAELNRLFEKGFLSKRDLSRVRQEEIRLFADSALCREMLSAKSIYREFRFNVMLPAALFTMKAERAEALADQKILLQGVIDCLIEDEKGNYHLIDYKTDRLSKAELSTRALAEKKLNEKHSLQLSYYALAVKEIFGMLPSSIRVYSLPLGDTVDIKPDPGTLRNI